VDDPSAGSARGPFGQLLLPAAVLSTSGGARSAAAAAATVGALF